MVKVAINLMRAEQMAGGSFQGLLDLARLADAKGVDEVHISDHLAMSRSGFDRHGHFPFAIDHAGWYEPLAALSAVAAVTTRVRLVTNILIAPLRSALLLAKQIATLDVISGGRADMGWGVSWHEEEYRASGIAFEGRFGVMEEQLRACRALWGGAPASFAGERIQFQDLYCLPLPVQGAALPVSFGLAPTERNLARMARVADGWFPAPLPPDELAAGIRLVRDAFARAGRDPGGVHMRAALALAPPQSLTMDQVFAEAPGLIAAGADTILAHPFSACRGPDEWEPFIDRLVALKG